jgi:hypothetical protein
MKHHFSALLGSMQSCFGIGHLALGAARVPWPAGHPRTCKARYTAAPFSSVKSLMAKDNPPACRNFQELILTLQQYWAREGCVIAQPYDMEMGAGTFHPATFLRAVGPEPWSAAYVQPCRRPTDGRYGDNPFRLQHYYQYQVVIKPSPRDIQERYLRSLAAIGIDPLVHDIRFVEDNWESPTLGAGGLGGEVWLNGMEVTPPGFAWCFAKMPARRFPTEFP